MTEIVKPVLGVTLGLQSMALMGRSARVAKDMFDMKSKNKTKKLVGGFTDIMVGTVMLKSTSDIANSF